MNIRKILEKYKKNNSYTAITKNAYFMKLYTDMKYILKYILKYIKIYTVKIENIVNFKISDYLSYNDFTSKEVSEYITNNIKFCNQITFENNIILYFTKKNISNTKVPKIIIQMFTVIKLLKILFKRDIETNVQKVTYFETGLKKKFPKNTKKILGQNEVNSGLTFIDLHKNGDIILYRKEEIIKVLIHELIHSNLIDEKIIFSRKVKEFSNLFCVDYNILLNEAFTESFATIINIFYIHIINKFKKRDLDTMFKNEMIYSTYISSKIMKYYKIDNITDVIKDHKCKNIFPQETNIFAYYILKNILLKNHIEFTSILDKFNNNYKVTNEETIDEIILLIMNNIKYFDKDIFVIDDKNKSLRMCLYES